MADKTVVDAWVSRLQAYLDTNPVVRPEGGDWPLIKPNEGGQTPNDGGSYITLQFPIGSEDMITAGGSPGNRLMREEGVGRIIVSVPRAQGQDVALDMINGLRGEFRYQEFSGIRTFGASPATDNNATADGAWWVLSTSIPYWFDFAA